MRLERLEILDKQMIRTLEDRSLDHQKTKDYETRLSRDAIQRI